MVLTEGVTVFRCNLFNLYRQTTVSCRTYFEPRFSFLFLSSNADHTPVVNCCSIDVFKVGSELSAEFFCF